MSNGDDENADAPEDAADEEAPADAEEVPEEETPAADADETETTDAEDAESEASEPEEAETTELSTETLESRLDDAEAALEEAETEADLDEMDADLEAIAADVEAADLPEPEDEEEEAPAEALESRTEELRGSLEEARGPYAEDVTEAVDEAATAVRDTRWTEAGEPDARAAIETFLETANEELGTSISVAGDKLDDFAAALESASEAVTDADLDPDADDETIASLLEIAGTLDADIDAAEEWDDLPVVEQLRARGFYDRMTSENRKDFPPELTVVRVAEAENDPERILMALEKLESDFMQENCIDALRRLGSEEAFEAMHERAQKRKQPPIEVLGKIGDERAVDTLAEFVDSGNPPLQKVTLRALGEIGSEDATQAVANALADEQTGVRSQAARALGLIGDTRAINPLADALGDESEDDAVRASAAWALVQIGTERALEAAAAYDDDRVYTVQVEAEKASDATAI
jgi:HEAT repeat protein